MARQSLRLDELRPGPIRHHQLLPALIGRIQSLRAMLDEVYPQSLAEWLDGFQRDVNPEPEVLWWERLARCYVDYSRRNEFNTEQRQGAFNVICKMALGANAADLGADLAHLPAGALDEILRIMRTIAGTVS